MTLLMMPRYSRELRRGEALHELRRLPELDLKNDGQGPVAAEPAEMEPGDFPQPLDRIGQGVDAPPAVGDRLLHRPLEDRDEEVVLAAEVEVDRAGGDAGGAGDVGDLGVEEAARGEGIDRGAQQRVALVGSVDSGGGLAARRVVAVGMNECSFSRVPGCQEPGSGIRAP